MSERSFPLAVVLWSSVATLCLGAGIVGLLAPEAVPQLARPSTAWSLIGVGIVMDIGAVLQLVRRVV